MNKILTEIEVDTINCYLEECHCDDNDAADLIFSLRASRQEVAELKAENERLTKVGETKVKELSEIAEKRLQECLRLTAELTRLRAAIPSEEEIEKWIVHNGCDVDERIAVEKFASFVRSRLEKVE